MREREERDRRDDLGGTDDEEDGEVDVSVTEISGTSRLNYKRTRSPVKSKEEFTGYTTFGSNP